LTLSATSSNPSIATVVQTSPGQFSVTGIIGGTCTITVTDSSGASAVVSISVTTIPVGVN
jgi:uncharacterized protein YjdB